MPSVSLPDDVIFLRAGTDRWVAYNVFTRLSLGTDAKGLQAIDRIAAGGSSADESCTVWDTSYFSNKDGLLADPTRLRRDAAAWGEPKTLAADKLRKALLDQTILVEQEASYRARFSSKSSALDFRNFGNFHQHLGQELIFKHREDPDIWWLNQKFAADMRKLQPNAYGGVQEEFIRSIAAAHLARGDRVLDLGCGPGYFTSILAAHAGETIGVDPNPVFLDKARSNWGDKARFDLVEVGTPGALDHFPSESFDVVFMSDALLFYFVSPSTEPPPDIRDLLNEIRRLLRTGGRFISVEPHYLFWLSPWLGSTDRPFTVLTEYTKKVYRVTGTQVDLLQALTTNGFCVTCALEAKPAEWFFGSDPRAAHFAAEFPLWQGFISEKR